MRKVLGMIAIGLCGLPAACFGQTPQPPKGPLEIIDGSFINAYFAQAAAMKATNPPYVEVSGSYLLLYLHGQEPIKVKVLTDPYHHLKDVAHVPFTVFLLLNKQTDVTLSDAQLAPIQDFETKLSAARAGLDPVDFTPEHLTRQRTILDTSLKFVKTTLASKTVTADALYAFARAMAPLMLENADEAGCFQVQATHQRMLAWESKFNDAAEWQKLRVVIKNSHQARYKDAATQYFAWLVGGTAPAWAYPGETNRVFYAETLFGKDDAPDELIDFLVDFDASQAFFGNEWRMTEDILSSGAARCVAALPNSDREWHPAPGGSK